MHWIEVKFKINNRNGSEESCIWMKMNKRNIMEEVVPEGVKRRMISFIKIGVR